ncbi:MAG: 16S rRNA (guanine(966)-N(2))-methyltransferase RsmD [Alphaproteobacteria bacterium]
MKIVSGKFGGRKLFVPKNNEIRPTSDKIRGAVFNMLQSRGAVEDCRVLDAFCGTGALGLEAISRGAKSCAFMDKSRISISLAQENADMLGVDAEFVLSDATKINARTGDVPAYNLVFIDPPYKKGLIDITVQRLLDGDWIAPDGWIVCESERYYTCSGFSGCETDSEKTYGDTKIILINRLADNT